MTYTIVFSVPFPDYQLVNKLPLYNAPHQYMHWPSRRPAVCPGCGKFFKFKYNMKIHLKKCAAAHAQSSSGAHLSSSSVALLGVVAAAAATANTNAASDDSSPTTLASIVHQPQHPPHIPHRTTSASPIPMPHSHLRVTPPTSLHSAKLHHTSPHHTSPHHQHQAASLAPPTSHHRLAHSPISPGSSSRIAHPHSNLPMPNTGQILPQSMSNIHSSTHTSHSAS